jgi:guanine deaminase
VTGALALRGTLAFCTGDPFLTTTRRAFVTEEDGGLLVGNGRIERAGSWPSIRKLARGVQVADWRGCILVPGFVDAHVHYVQSEIMGARARGLLEWLAKHAFPAERTFASRAHAARIADRFCDALLRAGTTTASVFCSVHPGSADALFAAAESRGLRISAGKVMMDRNVPTDLRDTPQRGYDESKALLRKWHGRARLRYAITPRFAASCSAAQLDAAGALWKEFPDAAVQTHVAENRREVAWVRELFQARRDYVDVYEHHGLLGPRSILAHGIHLSERELRRCHATHTGIAHCPTSNLFLGSGLFQLHRAKNPVRPVHVGTGTDVGAGTTLSMLRTLGEACNVASVLGRPLSAAQALFLGTLGGARALGFDSVGTFAPGADADVVVLDPASVPFGRRTRGDDSIEDALSRLIALGDERSVRATYVDGRLWKERGTVNAAERGR